jgi:hypothetical protein
MPESAIPAYITSLIRHFEDIRDGTHGGSASRNKSCADLGNPIPEECCQSIHLLGGRSTNEKIIPFRDQIGTDKSASLQR